MSQKLKVGFHLDAYMYQNFEIDVKLTLGAVTQDSRYKNDYLYQPCAEIHYGMINASLPANQANVYYDPKFGITLASIDDRIWSVPLTNFQSISICYDKWVWTGKDNFTCRMGSVAETGVLALLEKALAFDAGKLPPVVRDAWPNLGIFPQMLIALFELGARRMDGLEDELQVISANQWHPTEILRLYRDSCLLRQEPSPLLSDRAEMEKALLGNDMADLSEIK
jgi:hypothetical protein